MKFASAIFILLSFLSLSSCRWDADSDDYNPFQKMTAKELFNESQSSLKKEQYVSAIKRLEALESMYPFSSYAEQAQKNLIYAYYQKEDFASTVATADRFIHLYPRAKHVDYAYYMKGLANFQQARGVFAKILPLDESWRDPGTQSQAYADFATLVQKFPESPYRANALQRMIYLRNMFAQRELNTAEYYFQRKKYIAAAQRASFLVKNYPQAPSAKKALALIYHANQAMGLEKATKEALAVYQSTYQEKPLLPITG